MAAAATTPGFRSMFYDIEGQGSLTLADAVIRAREVGRFGQIVAQRSKYKDKVTAMKDTQPTMELLVYVNGTHTTNPGYDPAWYVRDKSGEKVRAAEPWQGNFLMDPRNADWTAFRIRTCLELISDSGFDGLYVDEVGTGCITAVSTGLPIDPATGTVWTTEDWTHDMSAFLGAIQNAVTHPVWFNGLREANAFWGVAASPTRPPLPAQKILLDTGAAGGAAELWLRAPGQPLDKFQDVTYWERTAGMHDYCGDRIMTLTKTWVDGTQAQKDQWHRYALSTFMNATAGGRFYFTYERAVNVTAKHPWWSFARSLGSPSGVRIQTSGLWKRFFSGGLVATNPTNTPITLQVPTEMMRQDGLAGTSFLVGGHDGILLHR